MSKCVLDSSAVLALFNNEPGHEVVEELLPHSTMSTVNIAEVIGKLNEKLGVDADLAKQMVYRSIKHIVPFDLEQAEAVGAIKKLSKPYVLSLGDRACIVLANMLGAPVYTADAIWSKADLNCKIIQIGHNPYKD